MPEAATGGFCEKNMFFKILQNSHETPVPEEAPVDFADFLKIPFSQNHSGQLLQKSNIKKTN